jgi:xanthine dehydrogenase small subunit
VLLALDAVATLNSAGATRDIALSDFFQGYRQTGLMPGEYLASVAFDMPASWSQLSFDKISKRYEDDISSVCAAIYIDQQDARVRQVRIAYGGVAATPMRLPEIEALLVDLALADIDSVSLSAALAEILKPISDVRASADYRLQMATTLLLNRLAFERERG